MKNSIEKIMYFAYGSNLHLRQMKKRCPGSLFIRRAYLENYRFIYDGYSNTREGAVASIIKSPGDIVYGGLFEITENDLQKLDRYEGYPWNYLRDYFDIADEKKSRYNAVAYFREGKRPGIPSEYYKQTVVQGAEDCGLPEGYISEYLL